MNSIKIAENKILVLRNVLISHMEFSFENIELFDTEIKKMSAFIQTHGASQIGPLIQFACTEIDEEDEATINVQFMLQADRFIHNVEAPYHMEPVMRVKECLYARYIGPEDKIKYAYDKLGVYAFENELGLDGSNYTIYLEKNDEEETMIADIFMPLKENGWKRESGALMK